MKEEKLRVTITLPNQEPIVFEISETDIEEINDKTMITKREGVEILRLEKI